MEKHAKFSVAATVVGLPLTLFAPCICYASTAFKATGAIGVVKMLLFGGFVLWSAVMLFFMGSGLFIMIETRRSHGTRWWGGDIDDPQAREGGKMTFFAVSRVAGFWLLLICLILEVYVGLFAPFLRLEAFRSR